MAVVTTTEQWDAAWTTTMRAKRKRLTDNFFDSYPTLEAFRSSGSLEMENGGKEIQEDLMYALNSSEWFDGYDTLNTDAVDGITAAFYVWRYNATPITISMTEERENKKSDRAEKLLTAKTQQSMTTAFDTVNAALHSAQSGKSINGFQDNMSTSANTVGGISASTESWWDNGRQNYSTNQSTNAFNTSSSGLYRGVVEMGDLWNSISEGNDKPTHIFCSFATGGDYEDIFEGTGFLRTSPKDKPGVDGRDPHYRTVPLIMDRDNAATSLYMVNSKYLKFKVQAGLNFAKTPFREGVNQLAKVAFVVMSCQLTSNNRRRQGVLHTITN